MKPGLSGDGPRQTRARLDGWSPSASLPTAPRSTNCGSASSSCACEIAGNADMPDYRAYRWRNFLRFDYTPDDCERFQDAIEEVVVPAATRIYEKRRQTSRRRLAAPLGFGCRSAGARAAAPLQRHRHAQRTPPRRIFNQVDPQLGDYFRHHAARKPARPRQPQGQSAGRLLHLFPGRRAPVHLHERRRPARRRANPAPRGRARLPRLRDEQAAALSARRNAD